MKWVCIIALFGDPRNSIIFTFFLFSGEEFKDKIIPHAVDYFTGKALEYEDFEGDDDFEVSTTCHFWISK